VDINKLLSIACFIMSIPQGASAVVFLVNHFRPKPLGTSPQFGGQAVLFLAALLVAGTGLTCAVGALLLTYHPNPIIVDKPYAVPAPAQPCLPAKTGSAASHGNNSPAHSGNNDSYTYSSPTGPKNPRN
jgi:hypothetical protein